MNREEAIKLIENKIQESRPEIVEALKKSFVEVNPDTNDKELLLIIEREILNGNGFLLFHLEEVVGNKEKTSSAGGDWAAAAIPTIGGLLGGLLGGGKSGGSSQGIANQVAQQQQQMMMQYQMASQQAQAEAARKKQELILKQEAARRSGTMMIVGVVGGIVVIGGIAAIILTKK